MAQLKSTKVFGDLNVTGEVNASTKITVNGEEVWDTGNLLNIGTTAATARTALGLGAGATRWPTFAEVTGKPATYAPSGHTHPISQVTGLDAALADKADKTTQVIAGTGLTGGGTLAANRTLAVSYGTTAGSAAQGNDSRINNGQTAFGWGNHASAGYVKTDTTYTAGNGLTLSGTAFSLPITVSGSGTYISDVVQTATGITVTKATPPNTNTMYAEITSAEVLAGTAATLRTITGRRLKEAVIAHGLQVGTTTTTAKAGNWLPSWEDVTGKPVVIAAGDTQAAARQVIGAGTSSLTLGTSAGTAAQGNDSRINNGQTAFGWGNHASAGYIKSYVNTTYTGGTGLTLTGTTFSVNYGTAAGTAAQGNDSRLSDSREWTAATVSQAEAEAGTATTRRAWTAQRVRQAILAWWTGSADKAKLDGIAAGAQVNVATDLGSSGTGATRTITSSTGSNTSITYSADDVGAVPTARTITAGTGLSGGGTLAADRTLSVSYGTAAGTAAQGNDVRINNGQTAFGWGSHASEGYAKTKADVGLSGIPDTNASTANFLRGDGTWVTPPNTNTTYSEITTAEIDAGTASTSRTITGRRMKYALDKKSDTGHTHTWAQVTGQPATATRWPTFAEVTGKPTNYATTWESVASKPAQATRWPTLAEVTGKPTNYPTNWATVSDKPIVQTIGTSTTNIMSQKAVTDAITSVEASTGQPSMTGSATLNGTTDNTVQLSGIVTTLGLEVGDVLRIQYSGYNKLHSVESITNNNLIVVNYEHAGNRGNGILKLPSTTASVTVTRITKWHNAPIGLGQAWVDVEINRASETDFTNTTGRTIGGFIIFGSGSSSTTTAILVDGTTVGFSGSSSNPNYFTVSPSSVYRADTSRRTSAWSELR